MSLEKRRPDGRGFLDIATAGAWVLLFCAAAIWFLVTTDRWPLSDRKAPATTVWAINDALGDWLLEHGEAEWRAPPPPPREALTTEESAEVTARLARMETKERLPVLGKMSELQRQNAARQAAAPSINVSVGGSCGSSGGGGGGGRGGGGCGGGGGSRGG